MVITGVTFAHDRIGLEVGGLYLDLHNNYEFSGLDERGEDVELRWVRSHGAWVPHDDPEHVHLCFRKADVLANRGAPSNEFMEYGFFQSSDQVDYNGLSAPEAGCEVLVIRFENGAEIALIAESATIRTG